MFYENSMYIYVYTIKKKIIVCNTKTYYCNRSNGNENISRACDILKTCLYFDLDNYICYLNRYVILTKVFKSIYSRLNTPCI